MQIYKVCLRRLREISATRNMKSRLAIKFPTPYEWWSNALPPGRKRRQMLGVCPGGGGGCWSFELTGTLPLREKSAVHKNFCCWSYFRLKDLHELIFAGGTINRKFKMSLWEKMLLSIKTAHFNFTLIRLNNISSPQFIRLNGTKCRLSKVILRSPCGSSRDKESQFSVGVQRGHFFVFVEWSFIVAMLLKPSLCWLVGCQWHNSHALPSICPRHRPLEDSTGRESHPR